MYNISSAKFLHQIKENPKANNCYIKILVVSFPAAIFYTKQIIIQILYQNILSCLEAIAGDVYTEIS